jgi:hypothetical protein
MKSGEYRLNLVINPDDLNSRFYSPIFKFEPQTIVFDGLTYDIFNPLIIVIHIHHELSRSAGHRAELQYLKIDCVTQQGSKYEQCRHEIITTRSRVIE